MSKYCLIVSLYIHTTFIQWVHPLMDTVFISFCELQQNTQDNECIKRKSLLWLSFAGYSPWVVSPLHLDCGGIAHRGVSV
jgi:hypothetical protein